MNSERPLRVFISYTGQDLKRHAEVVADVIQRLNSDTDRSWIAIDHKFWSPTGRPSVKECMEQVSRCQILIVLVAFRYGWVPTVEEGGDGASSITWLEVKRARDRELEVIPFLVQEKANWKVNQMEGLKDPQAVMRLDSFKKELSKSLAGFFESPESLEAQTIMALNKAAERLKKSQILTQKSDFEDSLNESEQLIISFYDPDHPPTLEERLKTQLPKRILSLDSAGCRTAIILGYLERLEALLRARYSDVDFRLSDYFDLIGATGASSIIAAELALGRTVAEARKTFKDSIKAMMSFKSRFFGGIFTSKYKPQKLQQVLSSSFGEITFNSEDFKTALCLTLTRIDTYKTYSLTNHPQRSIRFDNLLLCDSLLACLSIPLYLPPVKLFIAGESGLYFSGEISTGSNPALHNFLVATSPNHPFQWRLGERRVFLTSLGSGAFTAPRRTSIKSPFFYAINVITTAMEGLKEQSNFALSAFTRQDSQFQFLDEYDDEQAFNVSPGMLRYRRFDVVLNSSNLRELGFPELSDQVNDLIRIDSISQLDAQLEIGRRAGERDLNSSLFSNSFEVRPKSSP